MPEGVPEISYDIDETQQVLDEVKELATEDNALGAVMALLKEQTVTPEVLEEAMAKVFGEATVHYNPDDYPVGSKTPEDMTRLENIVRSQVGSNVEELEITKVRSGAIRGGYPFGVLKTNLMPQGGNRIQTSYARTYIFGVDPKDRAGGYVAFSFVSDRFGEPERSNENRVLLGFVREHKWLDPMKLSARLIASAPA